MMFILELTLQSPQIGQVAISDFLSRLVMVWQIKELLILSRNIIRIFTVSFLSHFIEGWQGMVEK